MRFFRDGRASRNELRFMSSVSTACKRAAPVSMHLHGLSLTLLTLLPPALDYLTDSFPLTLHNSVLKNLCFHSGVERNTFYSLILKATFMKRVIFGTFSKPEQTSPSRMIFCSLYNKAHTPNRTILLSK